jgi:peptide/nickel transport system substrate-binding protein
MDSKLSSIVITSVLAFALIAGLPAVFENVLAQQDGSGQTGGDAGMDQSQTAPDAGMDQSQTAPDAGVPLTQGNETGFAQGQPGADMGGITQDQSSADSATGDGGSGDGGSEDNGDGGSEDNGDNGDNGDNEDKEDKEED